jgi:hypothetical protein
MAKYIVVGCKLPHGIIIERPMNTSQKVELKGVNSAQIIGAGYATTEVDADFWAEWEIVNKDFPAFKSGAIFVAKSVSEAAAVAEDFKDRKTGFEAMQTDGKDERAAGVVPA